MEVRSTKPSPSRPRETLGIGGPFGGGGPVTGGGSLGFANGTEPGGGIAGFEEFCA